MMYHVKEVSKCSNIPCSNTIEFNLMEKSIIRHCQRFYTFEREERKENNIVADEHCSKCT